MKTLNDSIRAYIWGFKKSKNVNPIKPDWLDIVYDTEGFCCGKHRVHAKIQNTLGIVEICFSSSDCWGYVNNLGICKLNGEEIKTATLIGVHEYNHNICNMCTIIEKLANI